MLQNLSNETKLCKGDFLKSPNVIFNMKKHLFVLKLTKYKAYLFYLHDLSTACCNIWKLLLPAAKDRGTSPITTNVISKSIENNNLTELVYTFAVVKFSFSYLKTTIVNRQNVITDIRI